MEKKVAILSMYIALGIVVSYVELLIPFNIGIPGVKLGLANIVVLIALYQLGKKEAIIISIVRVVLVGLIFGSFFTVIYSLAGCTLSFLVMKLLYQSKQVSIVGVSVFGAVAHNIGQILVAMLIVENMNFLYYLPVLLVAGVITGALIGIVAKELRKRL